MGLRQQGSSAPLVIIGRLGRHAQGQGQATQLLGQVCRSGCGQQRGQARAQAAATKGDAKSAKAAPAKAATAPAYDKPALQALAWRNIGPYRGGRSVAAVGVESQPMTYYFGATGGGVFKTTNGGADWKPVTDGQLAFEWEHLLRKVRERDPAWLAGIQDALPRAHPMMDVEPGPVAPWERP